MIPKSGKSPADSRKSVGIHEFAALARSSLNGERDVSISLVPLLLLLCTTGSKYRANLSVCDSGISQAVRDHVTKPTSLAQGRVAHLIEWKGWPKPTGPPAGAHSQFNSYSHLTEGEKEARFAAGILLIFECFDEEIQLFELQTVQVNKVTCSCLDMCILLAWFTASSRDRSHLLSCT